MKEKRVITKGSNDSKFHQRGAVKPKRPKSLIDQQESEKPKNKPKGGKK